MRRPARLMRRVPLCSVVIACALALVASVPAHAGLGDMVKKAKEKAAQAAGQTVAPAAPASESVAPKFDEVTVELTEERVTKLLAAYQAANAASAGRAELVQKINKASDESAKIEQKSGEQIRATRNKRDEVNQCLHDAYQEEQNRRADEYRQKALTDPAIREKFTKAAAQYNARAAQGDTTAQQEIMKVIMSEVGLTHADSVAIQKKCGTPPPPMPAETRLAELDQQITSMQNELRAKDEKSADALSEGSGLDRQQFGMALDRIHAYLGWAQAKAPKPQKPPGYSENELKALGKHEAELRSAIGA